MANHEKLFADHLSVVCDLNRCAWSEFHLDFHATPSEDGSTMTHGVETQDYRKEEGRWYLVHVHYSEDRQPASQ